MAAAGGSEKSAEAEAQAQKRPRLDGLHARDVPLAKDGVVAQLVPNAVALSGTIEQHLFAALLRDLEGEELVVWEAGSGPDVCGTLSLTAVLLRGDVGDLPRQLSEQRGLQKVRCSCMVLRCADDPSDHSARRVERFVQHERIEGRLPQVLLCRRTALLSDDSLVVALRSGSEAELVPTLRTLLCSEIGDGAQTADEQMQSAAVHADAKHSEGAQQGQPCALGVLRERFWWARHSTQLLEFARIHGVGRHPLYVYSSADVSRRAALLRSSLGGDGVINRFFYAMKANPHPALLRVLHVQQVGFECVSLEEIRHVLRELPDLKPGSVLFTPNFAPREEYIEAFELGAFVTVDNMWALESWGDMFRGRSILLRVDAGEGRGHHAHVRTGGARSKFGISADRLVAARNLLDRMNVRVEGLHVHVGSGVFDHDNWASNAKLLASLGLHFTKTLRYINVGGGLGVQYDPSKNEDLQIDLLRSSLQAFRREWRGTPLANVELWLEPGRFFVADAGVLLCSVTQLKNKPGKSFVGLNSGMNSLIRPALYGSYHHIVNLSRLQEPHAHRVDVVGPICETGDVLGHDRWLPESTSEGDIVLVASAGAYGHCMGSNYNMRACASELIFEENT